MGNTESQINSDEEEMMQREFDDDYNPSFNFPIEQAKMLYERAKVRREAME